eukprot:426647-Pyramimonas_sp.AAC.1
MTSEKEGEQRERERLTQTRCSTTGKRWCGERGLTHQGSLELRCGGSASERHPVEEDHWCAFTRLSHLQPVASACT